MTEWRTIPGWPGYEAGDDGSIRRRQSGHVLRQTTAPSGYRHVGLWSEGKGRKQWCHRLVCAAFHGPAPAAGMDAAHANGCRSDNRPSNLRWATRSENERDKRAHGVSNDGERNGQAVLTTDQVLSIRARAATMPRSSGGRRLRKGSLQRLAADYSVTTSCISAILSNRHWRHVP